MTGPPEKPQSLLVPLALLLFLLVDAGLIIWGWHLYQGKKEKYDAFGFDLKTPPPASAHPAEALPARAPVPKKGPLGRLKYLVKDKQTKRTPATRGRKEIVSAARSRPIEERRKVRRATLFFFNLKNQPRFKNSQTILGWKREFLSHSDLKAVNDRYRKDGDAVRFMVDMTASEEVQDSADSFLEDVNIGAAVERIRSAVPPAETDSP